MGKLLKSLVEITIALPVFMAAALAMVVLACLMVPVYFLVALCRECHNERA